MGDLCRAVHDPNEAAAIVEEAIAAILSTVDLQTVLERTNRLLRKHFGQTRVTVHRVAEGPPRELEAMLLDDPQSPGERGRRRPLAGTACEAALRTREPVVLDPLDPEKPRFEEERELGRRGWGSLVSFPLLFEGQALGTLDIAHLPDAGLLACCFRTAQQLSRLLAIALHNSLMVEEVQRLNRLLDRENALLREEIRQIRKDSRYVAESPLMKGVIERVRLVAPQDTTVLIRGETGTGKEGLARMVHEFSPRFGKPFVVVNLAAIPETLVESELFGHEKGAFTGALRRKAGRFEQAEGGTLFLDEVGDAPMPVQLRLLRALQEHEVQRVGGTETLRVDVRVVAATNRPLEKMVEEGTFRSDLYYRLNVFPLHLPPLRERREDIRPLAAHFLARQSETMHRKPQAVSEAVWRALEAQPWPGNVRELENFVQRALILSPGRELQLPDLPPPLPRRQPAPESGFEDSPSFEEAVRRLLTRTLERCGNKIYGPGGAAAVLGLKPTTLQGKLRKYGIRYAD